MQFFVHVNAGTDRALDVEGKDYTDIASARAEAVEAVREIVCLKLHQGHAISPAWSIEIADPNGSVIERLSLEQVLFGASLPDQQHHLRNGE